MKPPNKRLKLTAPSVQAFCFAAGVEDPGCGAKKRAPVCSAAELGRWAD
jgi:hypothetical protein